MPKYAMTGTRIVPIIVLAAYPGAGDASVGGHSLCASHHGKAGLHSVREYCEDDGHRPDHEVVLLPFDLLPN